MIKQILLTIVLILLISTMVMAQDDIEVKMFEKLFHTSDEKVETFFHESFLRQVPANKIIDILNSYRHTLGQLEEVNKNNGMYTLTFTKGTAPARIVLNSEDEITGLWFGKMNLNKDTVDEIISEFKDIEGSVSVCVMKNNHEVLLSHNEDQKLAVGSSFKLYVLKAAYDAVASEDIAWDDVVRLNQDDKSLPSGILQDWKEGTPLTIKTLTGLMISRSDNTATDKMINLLGRDYIENYVTEVNIPFLKTNEMFKLKYAVDSTEQEEYIKTATRQKKAILENIKDIPLEVSMITGSPTLINEVEWFFSTKELCNVIYDLRKADEIKINPGLATEEDWYLIGYKGGSEAGVLQYTHILQKEKGDDIYTVSVTANNSKQKLNKDKITELTSRLISLIKNGNI